MGNWFLHSLMTLRTRGHCFLRHSVLGKIVSYAYPVPVLTSDPAYPAILFSEPFGPGRGCSSAKKDFPPGISGCARRAQLHLAPCVTTFPSCHVWKLQPKKLRLGARVKKTYTWTHLTVPVASNTHGELATPPILYSNYARSLWVGSYANACYYTYQ